MAKQIRDNNGGLETVVCRATRAEQAWQRGQYRLSEHNALIANVDGKPGSDQDLLVMGETEVARRKASPKRVWNGKLFLNASVGPLGHAV